MLLRRGERVRGGGRGLKVNVLSTAQLPQEELGMRGRYYLRQAIQKAGGTIAHTFFSYCRASYVQLVVKPVDDHFDYTPLP